MEECYSVSVVSSAETTYVPIDTIKDHLKSKKHASRKEAKLAKAGASSTASCSQHITLSTVVKSKDARQDFILDFVKMCTVADTQLTRSAIPSSLNLPAFWQSVSDRYPSLSAVALDAIWMPVASVDCERSFSQYKHLLNDRRESLSEENTKRLVMLYYNGDIEERYQ